MEAAAALSSLLIIVLIPVIDRAAHALLDWIISRHVPYDEADEAPHQTHFTMALFRGLQIVLVAAALLALVDALGYGFYFALRTEFGRTVLRALFDIGIVLVLGYLGWDLFKHFIRRWVPEEEEGPALPSDGEGG